MQSLPVLLIGYGMAGSWFHAPLIHGVQGMHLAGVVTGVPERQSAVRRDYPSVALFTNATDALQSDVEFGLAVVTTPNSTHVEVAAMTMERGLPTVVDKPLAPSAKEARHLVSLANSHGVEISVFHNRRWDGDFRTVKRLIDERGLGEIQRFVSRFDRWEPHPRLGWRESESREQGGGVLLDLGPHLVDQALCLFGRPDAVHAQLATRRNVASDDDFFLAVSHENGVQSHLYSSALEAAPTPRFHVSGSGGSYVKYGVDVQEERFAAGEPYDPERTGVEPFERWGLLYSDHEVATCATETGDWGLFYRSFRDCLLNGANNPSPAEDAVLTLEVLDAAALSATSGAVVDL